jgi:hypothetical protein
MYNSQTGSLWNHGLLFIETGLFTSTITYTIYVNIPKKLFTLQKIIHKIK